PALFVVAVLYIATALLFFSCWSRPDVRYLIGIHLFMPMLVVEGTAGSLDLVRALWRCRHPAAARALARLAAATLLVLAAIDDPARSPMMPPGLRWLVAAGAAGGLVAAGFCPRRRVAAVAVPLLAVALVGLDFFRTIPVLRFHAPFQQAQM